MTEGGRNSRASANRGIDRAGLAETSGLAPPSNRRVGGADQAGVRLYNERLMLSLVRRFGPLSKIDVARATGLSVQSTSAIINRLQADGLLKREAPLRGRVGQPTIPLSLDPDGAYSFGLKIGRRSCDLVLVDFRGAIRERARRTFAFPTPAIILDFVRRSLAPIADPLSAMQKRRIVGLGVAAPFQLWNWEAEIGAPDGALRAWRGFDIETEIAALSPYPVALCNDATAACAAEFFFVPGWRHRDLLYFFLGAFLGGGLVLDGALHEGRSGNAGALGSMPVLSKIAGGVRQQLIACASIHQLERRLESVGVDASSIWSTPALWADFGPHLDRWIEDAASSLAQASVAATSVLDFEAIMIDGAMPATVRDRLTARTAQIFVRLDRRGLSDVEFVSGTIGADARAIGAAALPLIRHFSRDREVVFKDAVGRAG